MSCREFTEFMHEYLFDILPAEERAEFERHLAECPTCVAYLDSYQKTILFERAAFFCNNDPSLSGEVPEELVHAILQARSRFS